MTLQVEEGTRTVVRLSKCYGHGNVTNSMARETWLWMSLDSFPLPAEQVIGFNLDTS